jgi:hypothetical protein
MTESEYWAALERRLTRELAAMEDDGLRFLWCDGFLPEEHALEERPPRISGRVWLGNGRRQEQWAFVLLLEERHARSREALPWASLLPAEDVGGWVMIDWEQRRLRLTPGRAVLC